MAVLSFPAKSRKPLPVIIVLGGFDTGEKAIDLLRDDLEVIYATTDYPYRAPNQRGLVRDLKEISAIRQAVHRTDLAIDELVDVLGADPRVDHRKVSFVGASFGAPFAISAAVRNPGIDGVVLVHAFGRVDLAITQQIINEWGWWSYPFAWIFGRFSWEQLAYGAPEAEARKLHSHQKVFYIYSDADEQLPCLSVNSMLVALGESPARVFIAKSKGGHLGPEKTEMLDELMEISISWLEDRMLL